MRTIAIVGGTGFLGRHVVEALEREGIVARPLSRRTGFNALRPDPETLRGCDAVVNLAGIKCESGAQTFRGVHVEAVERLMEATRLAGIRRLVHVSVVVARPDPRLPYHHTKWLGEEAVRASGLDWTILRPGVIYGEGDDLLSHLALMIRNSVIFPIVNDGSAPLMPVDVRDVAAAVAGAWRNPASSGATYDVVGPDRLTLRGVVEQVAKAEGRSVVVCNTPVALMRLPVWVMERVMRHPLSTGAQLAMLVEGLAGDPGPARRDLGVDPAPFTPERIRALVPPPAGPPATVTFALTALVSLLVALAFRSADPWMGMLGAMSVALAAALLLRPRMKPTAWRIGLGLASAAALVGLTHAALALWPALKTEVAFLYLWKAGHGTPFLAATLVVIVAGEELFWRGVVARFAIERLGRFAGVIAAALLCAAAHAASMNPLLVAASFGMGVAWGVLAAATDDLTAPFVCHLGWDAVVMLAWPVA